MLQGWASSRWLTLLFGGLLRCAAISELTGLTVRMRFKGHVAWAAGGVIAVATPCVVLETLAGAPALARIPDLWFRRVLAVVLAGPGAALGRRAA